MKTLETPDQAVTVPPAAMTENLRRGEENVSCRTRNIQRDVSTEGICTILFDRPNSSANVFDRETLLELDSHLDAIEKLSGLRGLILASTKPGIFIAGADVHTLAAMADAPGSNSAPDSKNGSAKDSTGTFVELIRLGQGVFSRLASLGIPTVAAVHGACVGGGFELALACEQRIASHASATKLGLPEVRLGIIPAWGGCSRLPRLIGLPKALDVVLKGKVVSADRAMKLGMIDEIAPRERLLEVARDRILKPVKLHRPSLRVTNNPVSAALIRTRAVRDLAVNTRGNYPAPFQALEVATHGISLPLEKSLELECEAVLRLADTEACRNLLRLFLLKERAKKVQGAAEDDSPAQTANRVAIIGAGVMGAGIAQWLASRGITVILRDVSLEQLVRGMTMISELFEDAVNRHHLTPLEARNGRDRVFAAATDASLRDVDLVIEAATETLPLKQDIFRCLAAQTPVRAILATNTSALSIAEIASATTAANRIIGFHFFNPVHRMELVEVVSGAGTSAEVVARAVRFAQRIGKVPVVVKDSPGFLVNRILMPYLVEAVRLFDVGASAHDIDESMLDFGMPMGPLRLLDEVGLDVAAHVVTTLSKHFCDLVRAPALIEKMISARMLGRKSGRGFYDYAHDKPNHELEVMRTVHRHAHFTRDELAGRMSLLMVNEAARCVEEGIARAPADIDLAMVLGSGFAPFRGGPLRYADHLGVGHVVSALDRMADLDARFAPCALLKRMADKQGSFYPKTNASADRIVAAPPRNADQPASSEKGSTP